MKTDKIVIAAILVLFTSAIAYADTYSTFTTKRFYSGNQRYFVEVLPDKRATLYLNEPRVERLWSRVLPQLPARLFVSNDGTRVVMVDFYYGDGGRAASNVLLFFDEAGTQTATHALGEIANLPRVHQTTSGAHWLYGAYFTPDEKTFILETMVSRCEVQSAEKQDCWRSDPYEELRFSIADGSLIARADIRSKYADREKRLVHELELIKTDRPVDYLDLSYALIKLAHLYEDQGQHAKAKTYYETAIPIYANASGSNAASTASYIAESATNCRKMKDYNCAESLFRQSLDALDKEQKDPNGVSPAAITAYEEYAILLRELSRNEEATKMEERAKVLRAASPNYKPSERY
ncbi:MAG TPA: tetratricopeptide repeat protein [Pyrinomonadaceae bacterium]|nr:tetratricopeptide repeat protein [Pyrinomonadaceae bacterium]